MPEPKNVTPDQQSRAAMAATGLPGAQQHDQRIAVQEPTVGHMLQAFIDKGLTKDNMEAFERLITLKERQEDRQAEREFAVAFNALQSDMPEVNAVKPVPNKDGTTRYTYAPYEEIMAAVRPCLKKHGFTLSFSSDIKEDRIIQVCTLQHISGHKRSNQFMAKIGSGPPQSSGAQADGAANTYAKRQALCDALNIVVNHDTDGADARNEGAPINFEQAQTLKELVKETKSDEAVFLKYAGASTYDEIGTTRYQELFNALQKKLLMKS